MTIRLAPYGLADLAGIIAKIGIPGKNVTPRALVDLMPSPEIAAKVGGPKISGERSHRVVRLNRQG